MKQKEKSAIVRLLSDLIKADTVIDTREIDLFEKICSRYNIDVPETLVEAQKLTLSEALSALEALSASERRTLVEDLENIAIADGKCEPEEALLLLALRQILSGSGRGYDKSKFDNLREFLNESNLVMYAEGHANALGAGIQDEVFEEFINYSN